MSEHTNDIEGLSTEASGTPLVSIIVPFLDASKYLRECIESVTSQTYTNWELLLIDDGSTDGSAEIVRKFTNLYPSRVTLLQHPGHANRGQSASRNLGVAHSVGEFLTFLDADDTFEPEALAIQVRTMAEHPEAGAVIAQTLYWRSWDSNFKRKAPDYIVDLGVPMHTLVHPPTLLLSWYPLGLGPAPCLTGAGLVMRRHSFDAIGGFEESFHGYLGLYEDQCFLAKLYLAAPVYVHSECVGKYRQHPGSFSAKGIAAGYYDQARLRFLLWFAEYVQHHHLDTPEIHALLEQAMWPYRHRILHGLVSLPRNSFNAAKSIAKKLLRS